MIRPPIVGPRIGASIIGIDTMLITRPIRVGPAAPAIIIIPSGISIPPPTPWTTRKMISSVAEVEMPQSIDPPVNSTSEITYIRRAPKRSAAQPVRGITAARESR